MRYDMGVVGLGVMGQNLALNIASKGFAAAGFDLDAGKTAAASGKWAGNPSLAAFSTLNDLAGALKRPRKILLMVPAGAPVDAAIRDLRPLLEPGDIIIDGGNSFFLDTERRAKELAAAGIRYIGSGVSGGEQGALLGPALMPGGDPEAYRELEPVFNRIAAQVDGSPCSAYIGPGGAGHYVKMVHNGIEYGIMQLISEVYDLMQTLAGMSAAEMQPVFAAWNEGELNSYLIEITASVLAKTDPETGRPLVDVILDKAGQKGTGKWTSQNALDLGVAVPTINAALEARILSAFKDERVAASRLLRGPAPEPWDRQQALADLHDALRLAIITCYAQGFALMREASREYGYNLDFARIASVWLGGCIIRARALEAIRSAFTAQPDLPNLLTAEPFRTLAESAQARLRAVVARAALSGVPVLALAASLGYLDSYRRERLPANLLQAQRDYFGAHKYERVDKPRGQQFHTEWTS